MIFTANGTVDPATWKALIVQVKKGASGDAVRGVQEEFQFRNGSGDPTKGVQIDGAFGPQTDAAVRGFQHALSLDIPSVAVDGISLRSHFCVTPYPLIEKSAVLLSLAPTVICCSCAPYFSCLISTV